MRFLSKNKLVLLPLSVAMAASLCACSSGSPAPSSTEPSGSKAEPAASKEPVTITFYRPNTSTTEEEFNKILGDAIKAKFPNVTPKLLPFDSKIGIDGVLTSGNDMDIVLLSIGFVSQYPNYNLQYDMNEYIKKTNYDLGRLESTTVDYMKNFGNGQMYALPIWTAAVTLMYNKDLFDKFGVSYPKDGMTWDETYELAKKMTRTDNGQQYYGLMMSPTHLLRTNQFSQPHVDVKTNKPLLDNDNFKKLFENLARFYKVNEQFSDKKPTEANLFTKDRTLAMYAFFNNTMLTAPDDMNVDAVSLPTFKELPGTGPQMYPTYAGVASISKHKDLAFQIIAYLTSDEMQRKFTKDGTGLPILKNSTPLLDAIGEGKPQMKSKNKAAFIPAKPAAIPTTNVYEDLAVTQLSNAFTEVVTGKADINTALRKAQEQATNTINAAIAAKSAKK